jgi:hypothetical protein
MTLEEELKAMSKRLEEIADQFEAEDRLDASIVCSDLRGAAFAIENVVDML